jgi:hypothetical protein
VRIRFTACSRSARFAGFRFSTRTTLSPLPIPQIIRFPVISARVAKALAVTVGSRLTGFVTSVPNSILSLRERPISQPRTL